MTTHPRAVWELFRARRSSRWLSFEEVAPLFASASFGRSYAGESTREHRCSRSLPPPLAHGKRAWWARDGPREPSRTLDPRRRARSVAGGALTYVDRPLTPSVAHQAPPRRLQPDGSTRSTLPPACTELRTVCFT